MEQATESSIHPELFDKDDRFDIFISINEDETLHFMNGDKKSMTTSQFVDDWLVPELNRQWNELFSIKGLRILPYRSELQGLKMKKLLQAIASLQVISSRLI